MKAFSRKTYIKHIFILLFTSFIIHKSYALQDYNKSYKEIIEPFKLSVKEIKDLYDSIKLEINNLD